MKNYDYNVILETMMKASRAAGELMRNSSPKERLNTRDVDDMVTMIDLEADQIIRKTLLSDFPDKEILSEEMSKGDFVITPHDLENFSGFIVDSIDGSVNFSRMITKKYGNFAVSIAYAENGKIMVGVVYKPLEDEMFHAIRGKGAFQDDKLIHVSEIDNINKASIELGSFWIREETETFLKWFKKKETDVAQILIRGSAAAGLCDVARGRVEAMLHTRLNAWDYAAGWLIVEEAGGIVMDKDGTPLKLGSRFVYATNRKLNKDILSIVT